MIDFGYASEDGATFTCSLNGSTRACPTDGTVSIRGLAAGSYDFAVTASDAAGNVDPTPATRRFYVPVNDRALDV